MASYKKHVFTPVEKRTFKDILRKYSYIVENKNTDGATLGAKKEAWEKLTAEYNSSPQVSAQVRSQQLRRLWMNMKHRQRDALTKERQHRMATGGPSTSDAVMADPKKSQVAPALVGIDETIDSNTIPVLAVLKDEISEEAQMNHKSQSSLASSIFTAPHPLLPTPSPPPISATPLPPSTSTMAFQRLKSSVLQNEYEERNRRANEIHELEVLILHEKLREAKAKADLAELLLRQKQNPSDYDTRREAHLTTSTQPATEVAISISNIKTEY